MEMRACEDVNDIGEDLTPRIPPIAFSLYDRFLHSHCSSCFRSLSLPNYPLNSHSVPLYYCSSHCSSADSLRHLSSGEHHLFLLLQSQPTTWQGDTSDLRTALRLLFVFDKLGFFPFQSDRIFGLMSNRQKLEEYEEESDEVLARIREGGRLMSLARRMRDGEFELSGEETMENNLVEETVLCQVLTNAVEVQVSEERTLGIAVYGPSFSWINHSCSPNVCYGFSLVGSDSPDYGESKLRIIADGDEEVLRRWVCDESKLNNELCDYGPRIIVRSIKLIKKGEEVCVSYTDLLQPKEDAAANLMATNSSLDHNFHRNEAYKELTEHLDEAISEYLLVGNPKSCCEKLESILNESFQEEQSQLKKDPSGPNFKLHALHHLSLNAYITLASAYKIRASNLLVPHSGKDNHKLEAFELSRTSAAYSLLLAGAAHHLFLSESSLIPTATNFWLSAGESLLGLARSLTWNSIINQKLPDLGLAFLPSNRPGKCSLMYKLELHLFRQQSQNTSTKLEFEEISKGFTHCTSRISRKIWPFLINHHRPLIDIKDPIDFNWIGMTKKSNAGEYGDTLDGTNVASHCGNGGCCGCRCGCCGCRCVAQEERTVVFWLGAHCLLYGGYLASICYGHHCYLTGYVMNLLGSH